MTLFIGTSGWAYSEWKPEFYPPDLPQARFLEHYAQQLSACEINATFYRLQAEQTLERWAAAAPHGFRYAIKAHRRITHSRSMSPDNDFLGSFLTSLTPLREGVGAILLQYPPRRERDDDALRSLLEALPRDIPCAFEFRHSSWHDVDVESAVADAGGTICVSDSTGDVPARLPPGRVAYVRLRAERYTDAQRRRWLDLLQLESRTRNVFAFSKHEGIPAGDEFGGLGLALWLRHRATT